MAKAFQKPLVYSETEHCHQKTLIDWWRYECRYYGCDERLLFAVPNGGLRSKATAAILKREGVRPGVPDLFLAVPRGTVPGLFVEMKTGRGVVRDVQLSFMELLRERGYRCVVARGFGEARRAIIEYLEEV